MRKNSNFILYLVIAVLVIISVFSINLNNFKHLFALNNTPMFEDYEYDVAEEEMAFETESPSFNSRKMSMKMMANGSNATNDSIDAGDITKIEGSERKLVRNISLNCETKKFDEIYENIDKIVGDYKAIIDNHSLNNGSIGSRYQNRNCNFNIRVPSDNYDSFIEEITKDLNVTYKYESVDDITDNYNDTLARLDSLKLEETKLNELIARATKVEDMVNIEDKLSDVRYQIQSIEKRIKNMDKTVDYCTINLNISEVAVLTQPKDNIPTKDNILSAFKKNLNDTINYIKNTGIYIFTHLPSIIFFLIVCAIVFVIIVLLIKLLNKKFGNKEFINFKRTFDQKNNKNFHFHKNMEDKNKIKK